MRKPWCMNTLKDLENVHNFWPSNLSCRNLSLEEFLEKHTKTCTRIKSPLHFTPLIQINYIRIKAPFLRYSVEIEENMFILYFLKRQKTKTAYTQNKFEHICERPELHLTGLQWQGAELTEDPVSWALKFISAWHGATLPTAALGQWLSTVGILRQPSPGSRACFMGTRRASCLV